MSSSLKLFSQEIYFHIIKINSEVNILKKNFQFHWIGFTLEVNKLKVGAGTSLQSSHLVYCMILLHIFISWLHLSKELQTRNHAPRTFRVQTFRDYNESDVSKMHEYWFHGKPIVLIQNSRRKTRKFWTTPMNEIADRIPITDFSWPLLKSIFHRNPR